MKITIIIPVYNAEKYLDKCIETVRMQTYQQWEIIAVDDGSLDGSLEVLKKYRDLDSRITVHEQSNQGAGTARNYGIKHAQGDYIAFLDADDYWADEGCLEKLVSFLIAKEYPAVVGTYFLQEQDGIVNAHPLHRQYELSIDEGKQIEFKEEQEIFFYWSYIFRTNFLKENAFYFPSYRRYQDPPFLLDVLHMAERFYVMPINWYVYRITGNHTKLKCRQTNDLFAALLHIARKAKEYHYEKILKKLREYVIDEGNILNGVAEGSIQLLVNLYYLAKYLGIEESEEPHFHVLITIINDWIEQMRLNYEKKINNAEQIIIYGTGLYGKRTFEALKEKTPDKPVYFAVSKKNKEECINDIVVEDIHELNIDSKNVLVLIANRNAREEMKNTANELGYTNIVIVDWIYKMIMW